MFVINSIFSLLYINQEKILLNEGIILLPIRFIRKKPFNDWLPFDLTRCSHLFCRGPKISPSLGQS